MTNQRNSEVTPLLITNASTVSSVGEANTDSTQDALRKARRLLYVSHSASQFSEQSWQFGLILFLAAFTNYTSLILVSSYGLATGLTVCLAGPSAGRYFVDSLSWNRLSAAQFLISAQTLSVLTATAFCYALLIFHKQQQDGTHASQFSAEDAATANWFHRWLKGVPLDGYSIILLIGIHFFGPLAQILDKSFLISIERDWVVVMGQVAADGTMINDTTGLSNPQPSKTWLSETNVFMKQIDLSCRVAAPAVSGFVIGAATSNGGKNDLANAALFVGILNAAALVVEYFCTAHIYKLIPTLGVKHAAPPAKGNSTSSKKASDEENGDKTTTDVQSSSTKDGVDSGCGCGFVKLPNGLRIYMEQPISWAGLGLAML